MKKDNPLNIKVDDRLLALVNHATNALDCSLSDLVRASLEVGIPVLTTHPYLIRILPIETTITIRQS